MNIRWIRHCMLVLVCASLLACSSDDGVVGKNDSVEKDGTDLTGDTQPTDTTADLDDTAPDDMQPDDTEDDLNDDSVADVSEDVNSPDVPPTGEFDVLFNEVFVTHGCTAGYCHGSQAGGLQLRSAQGAYDALVDQEAFAAVCGSTLLVSPGSPEDSILWARVRPAELDPEPACAGKMPEDSPLMPEADANRIRDWIAAGAPR